MLVVKRLCSRSTPESQERRHIRAELIVTAPSHCVLVCSIGPSGAFCVACPVDRQHKSMFLPISPVLDSHLLSYGRVLHSLVLPCGRCYSQNRAEVLKMPTAFPPAPVRCTRDRYVLPRYPFSAARAPSNAALRNVPLPPPRVILREMEASDLAALQQMHEEIFPIT